MAYTPPPEPDTPALPAAQGVRGWFGSTAIFAGIMACALGTAVIVSAVGGLAAGQRDLNIHATQTTAAELDAQFILGLNDLAAGRNGLAAQRFQWVLERSPDYPGAVEALAQANAENPDVTTVPTIPPSSADSIEELYAEADAFYAEGQWESTLARLDELIALDPAYRQVEVRDMQFTAYQELGLAYVRDRQ